MTQKPYDFVVAKDELAHVKFIEPAISAVDDLPDGALLVRVDRFAFTANNITYALMGDALKYWTLFPAPDGFGNIPVWGFGEVIASKHDGVGQGEMLFGYLPMATHFTIEATHVTKGGLRDGAAHRQGVAPVYNAYARIAGDAAFAGRQGDYQALLRPLFMLSFLVDDYLAEHRFFGAEQIILSSASSKTAFGLAHLLHGQRQPIRIVGLTSVSNVDFVRALGCYDDVVTYDAIAKLPTDIPSAYVDMAGNADLRAVLHRHLRDRIVYSGRVGLTHQNTADDAADLPGAAPQWFFAPDRIRKRAKEWGPGGIDSRFGAAWATLVPKLDAWLEITDSHGPEALKQVYLDTLAGRISPDQAHMVFPAA